MSKNNNCFFISIRGATCLEKNNVIYIIAISFVVGLSTDNPTTKEIAEIITFNKGFGGSSIDEELFNYI